MSFFKFKIEIVKPEIVIEADDWAAEMDGQSPEDQASDYFYYSELQEMIKVTCKKVDSE